LGEAGQKTLGMIDEFIRTWSKTDLDEH